MTTPTAPAPPAGVSRRLSRLLHRRPRLRLGLIVSGPIAWLVVAYLGSLAVLLVTSLYSVDPFNQEVIPDLQLDNFHELLTEPVYRTITQRTIVVAATVTLIDLVIALPIAFTMAKIVGPRLRRLLVVAVLMPLWASYLVKAYAFRAIFDPAGGVLKQTFGWSPGFGLTATTVLLAYLWLPYMILPIYAGLERLPDSLLEASADLGGKAWTTFRRVVIPVLLPAIIAGSIFTFSLSLGDYIAVDLVGGTTQLIGSVVYDNFSANLPFAAAYATVPIVIMVVYLLLVRRTGALENL